MWLACLITESPTPDVEEAPKLTGPLEALNASDGQILWNFEPDVPVWNFLALFPDKDAWCLFKMAVAGLSRIFCYNMVLCFF